MQNVRLIPMNGGLSIEARIDEHEPWIEVDYYLCHFAAQKWALALDHFPGYRMQWVRDADKNFGDLRRTLK